jgi:hypothetical protein
MSASTGGGVRDFFRGRSALGFVAAGCVSAALVLAAGCAGMSSGPAAAPSAASTPAVAAATPAAAPAKPVPSPVPVPVVAAAAKQVPPHPLPERDEPKKPVDYKKPPLADNSRCYVCHLNLEDDPFVRWHAWGGAGCEKCHGASDDHCGDENHETAPDILYAKEKLAVACWECHPEVKPPKGFKPPVPGDAKKVCTDCHGQHRLERRQRKWDKETRKLIVE